MLKYVQGAIGEDADESFYKTESVFELYKLAVNAIAANWFTSYICCISTTAKRLWVNSVGPMMKQRWRMTMVQLQTWDRLINGSLLAL